MSKTRSRFSPRSSISASPSGPAGAEADELAAAIAQQPLDVQTTDKLSPVDKKYVLNHRHRALEAQRRAISVLKKLDEGLTQELDSEKEDRELRREAKLEDVEKRREAKLEDARARRRAADKRQDGLEKREDARLAQEIDERRTETKDRSRERNLFMFLTAVSFAATVILAVISANHAQPWSFVGSGIGLALSGGGLYRLRALEPWDKDRQGHGSKDG